MKVTGASKVIGLRDPSRSVEKNATGNNRGRHSVFLSFRAENGRNAWTKDIKKHN